METNKLLNEIIRLSRLEIDAIHCYNQAIQELDQKGINKQLKNFREDHRDHLEGLSTLIYELGGVSQNYSREFSHFWNQFFTPVLKGSGPVETLKVLVSNENIISRYYDYLLTVSPTCDLRAHLEENYEDEQDHVIYMEEVISVRP